MQFFPQFLQDNKRSEDYCFAEPDDILEGEKFIKNILMSVYIHFAVGWVSNAIVITLTRNEKFSKTPYTIQNAAWV